MKTTDDSIAISSELSRHFAAMSFVCAILIVALHSLAADKAGLIVRCAFRFVSGGVCETAIPWFFFAAGFFLAGHIGEDGWWKREVLKRIRTLLVPFWIWSVAIFSLNVAMAIVIRIFNYQYGGPNAMEWLSFSGFARLVGLDYLDTMPTMWFLRTLFVFVIFSPLLARLGEVGLLVLFVCSVAFPIVPWADSRVLTVGFNLLSMRGLFYFSAGLFLRRFKLRRTVPTWMVFTFGIGLAIAKIVSVEMGLYGVATALDSAQLPMLTYAVFLVCKMVPIPRSITELSFPIYVTHMMIVLCVSAVYGVLGIGGAGSITMWKGVLRFVLALVLTIPICIVLKKKFPRFSGIAFGGR